MHVNQLSNMPGDPASLRQRRKVAARPPSRDEAPVNKGGAEDATLAAPADTSDAAETPDAADAGAQSSSDGSQPLETDKEALAAAEEGGPLEAAPNSPSPEATQDSEAGPSPEAPRDRAARHVREVGADLLRRTRQECAHPGKLVEGGWCDFWEDSRGYRTHMSVLV